MPRRRLRDPFPPSWMKEGEDPDYRYSLANERTFLAWIRTALALLAGAIGIAQIVPHVEPAGARRALGILLAIAGVLAASLSYRHWARNERAMRRSEPLPFSPLLIIATTALSIAGMSVLALVALSSS